MEVYETWIASVLTQNLIGQRSLGRAVSETLFDFTKTVGNKRRPDLAFVSYQRWPRKKTSSTDGSLGRCAKPGSRSRESYEYSGPSAGEKHRVFSGGGRTCLVIYPSMRQVYIYSSPNHVHVVMEDGELADDTLFPGFRLTLHILFNDMAAQ